MDLSHARSFVIWMLNVKKLKPSTVKSYLSSTKLAHTLSNIVCDEFNKDDIIKMALKGAENISYLDNCKIKTRTPMSISSLLILGHQLNMTSWKAASKQLVWTACVISFFTSCRMGELLSPTESSYDDKTTLLWKHVTFMDNYATIFVPFTKTRGLQGHVLEIFEYEIDSCCPYWALKNLFEESKNQHNFNMEMPVFKFNSGKLLTTKKLNEILKDLMSTLGSESNYSCHSFRAAIPSLISSHPDKSFVSDILEWGEWSSPCYNLYTKLDHDRRKYLFDKVTVLLKCSLK